MHFENRLSSRWISCKPHPSKRSRPSENNFNRGAVRCSGKFDLRWPDGAFNVDVVSRFFIATNTLFAISAQLAVWVVCSNNAVQSFGVPLCAHQQVYSVVSSFCWRTSVACGLMLDACFKFSNHWHYVEWLRSTINLRVHRSREPEAEMLSAILDGQHENSLWHLVFISIDTQIARSRGAHQLYFGRLICPTFRRRMSERVFLPPTNNSTVEINCVIHLQIANREHTSHASLL